MKFTTMDAKLLKGLLDEKRILLVDVRDREAFDREHIINAISVPLSSFPLGAEDKLKKDDRIVVYCTNLQCTASPTAAQRLVDMGYEDVSDFEAGLEGWKAAGFPTHSLAAV